MSIFLHSFCPYNPRNQQYHVQALKHSKNAEIERVQTVTFLQLPTILPIFYLAGSLTHEAREAFLSVLVPEGHAEWMDKGHRKYLIL
ncbi:hypothetical protein PHAVU_002G134150 [Phaseolus vulgaris]